MQIRAVLAFCGLILVVGCHREPEFPEPDGRIDAVPAGTAAPYVAPAIKDETPDTVGGSRAARRADPVLNCDEMKAEMAELDARIREVGFGTPEMHEIASKQARIQRNLRAFGCLAQLPK